MHLEPLSQAAVAAAEAVDPLLLVVAAAQAAVQVVTVFLELLSLEALAALLDK